jgi:transglutaminase-like putative cysteine protease
MIYDISHRTTYRYGKPVLQSRHLVHLTPRSGQQQTVQRHNLFIEPAPTSNSQLEDYFGNRSAILTVEEQHSQFVIHARSTVEVRDRDQPLPQLTAPWESVSGKARRENGELDIDVLQFVSASRHTKVVPEAIDFVRPSFPAGQPVLAGVLDLTQRIHRDFIFDPTATDISTPVSHVLQERRGVCQDFAHLTITCLRALGLPTRYVSGYLLTRPPPGMEKLQGADASHAWISVWAPEVGWVDFDPTNGIMPSNEHITLAYGRDFDDVSPVSGVLLGGSKQKIDVEVDVAVAG